MVQRVPEVILDVTLSVESYKKVPPTKEKEINPDAARCIKAVDMILLMEKPQTYASIVVIHNNGINR